MACSNLCTIKELSLKALDILLSAKETPFTDEAGKKGYIKLDKPMTDKEIESLSRRLRSPLSLELEGLLRCTSSFDSALGPIMLNSPDGIADDFFPHGLTIGADGVGNYWIADLTGETSAHTLVFFVCHDPPVIALQAESIGAFIADVIAYGRKESNTAIEKVTKQSVDAIRRNDPGLLEYEQCLQSDGNVEKIRAVIEQRL